MTDGVLTDLETRVLGALDEQAVVDHLVALIRVPSITGTDAESDLQHRHAAELTELGFDVDAWKFDLDELYAHPEFPGTEADRSEGYGVVGTWGGTGTPDAMPALVLQGHVDVVPTGDVDKWVDRDPFSGSIRDGVVHGRGACDMKAGAAANLAVARTLQAAGVTLERPLALHSVVSEEDGGLGAFATMLRGHRGEAAVLTEPTSGRLVIANAGALTFSLTISGRAAHGSTRLEGFSAFEAFLPVHHALLELERERNAEAPTIFRDTRLPYPISIGKLRAGDWASSVPDLLVAEGRLGVRLGESPDDARTHSRARSHGRAQPIRGSATIRSASPGRAGSSRAVVSTRTPRSSTRSRRRSPTSRAGFPSGRRLRTAATCACTRGSAASPRCTTDPATCDSRTRRASRWRSRS